MEHISYIELAKVSKELKDLTSDIKSEINKISNEVAILENDSGLSSLLGTVSLSDCVERITSNFYNYNSVINKFASFLDNEVIKETQKMQSKIQQDVKKWESSLNKLN